MIKTAKAGFCADKRRLPHTRARTRTFMFQRNCMMLVKGLSKCVREYTHSHAQHKSLGLSLIQCKIIKITSMHTIAAHERNQYSRDRVKKTQSFLAAALLGIESLLVSFLCVQWPPKWMNLDLGRRWFPSGHQSGKKNRRMNTACCITHLQTTPLVHEPWVLL